MSNLYEVTSRLAAGVALAAALVVAPGCGPDVGNDGRFVGGPCDLHEDCDIASRCLEGGSYPEGMCVPPCDGDDDCPPNTWCIDERGGVCMLACETNAECRRGYICDEEDRRGGGERFVCTGDR